MKFLSVLTVVLCMYTVAVAQIINLPGTANAVIRETSYSTIEGSPYLYPEFKSGIILTRTNAYTKGIYIRYDVYKDEVQFQQDGGAAMIASPAEVTKFSFTELGADNTIVYIDFKNGFNVDSYTLLNYFNVLYDGETKCLKKYIIDYIDVKANAYANTNGAKRFEQKSRIFVLLNGKSIELKGNRKTLLDSFGNHKDVMSRYIKENNLNLKDDKDLINVLKKFDELGA